MQRSAKPRSNRCYTERLGEIFAHQFCFQGGHVGAYLFLFCSPSIHRVCPETKAASARVSADINFAIRPDDNRHLIVHESAGLETGNTQSLRVIQDFISSRTDPSLVARKRLHAIW